MSISNAPTSKPFFSITDVAAHLDVNPRTIRRWVDKGDLVAHRFGRLVRISRGDAITYERINRNG